MFTDKNKFGAAMGIVFAIYFKGKENSVGGMKRINQWVIIIYSPFLWEICEIKNEKIHKQL